MRSAGYVFVGPLSFDPAAGELTNGSSAETLPVKASTLLQVLHEAGGSVVSREDLLDRCWGDGNGSDEALTQTIAYLRRTIERLGGDPRLLRTYPKRGYALKSSSAARPTPPSAPLFRASAPRGWLWVGAALAAVLLALVATRPHFIRHLFHHGLGLEAPPQ